MKKKKWINSKVLLTIALISILYCFMTTSAWAQFKFIAYGDSRTNAGDHDDICENISFEDPELILHSGDLWDGYSSSKWKSHFTSRSNLNTLLNNNKILVARGNHESSSEVLNFSPKIVKNNSTKYAFMAGNVFFVCLGMDPSASYLKSQLQTTEAQNADFRVIYHHYPIYSAGSHGANGDSAIEAICDQYNVTMSFAGHDHHYERSKVIYDQSSVHSGNDVPATVKGTTYVVTGGAGAPLYSADSGWWTDYAESKNHFCVLTAYSDRLEMTVKDINGSVIETFVRRKKEPLPQVSLTTDVVGQGTISPPSGNYDKGSTLSMTASPEPGWTFGNWSGDLTGSDNPQDLLMNTDSSVTATFMQTGGTIGITEIGPKSTTSKNRRAAPFIMPEGGLIESIAQYHIGGSGNMYLAIYEGTSRTPQNRIATTPSTSVSSSTGWQTINLTSPVFVANGTQLWLAWVYENNPGIAYNNGTPGRVDAGVSWSGGMPESWGSTANQAAYKYSIYATYSIDSAPLPVAAFTANPTKIKVGQSVAFTDQSTHNPTSWSWTFEEGTPGSSTTENPKVTYNTTGTYSVTLKVTNSTGNDVEVKNNYITVSDLPGSQYTLTKKTVGQGTISLNPPGEVYDEGTTVTLTAIPDAGWQFKGWSGDLTGIKNPMTTTMNVDKTVTATFSEESLEPVVLEENTSGEAKMDIKEDQMGAQSFVHDDQGDPNYKITKIVLHLSRDSDTPDANFMVSIGTDVNSGALSGSQHNIKPSQITDTSGGSTFMKYEIIYTTPVGPLQAGVEYFLNFDGSAPNGKPYYIEFSGDDVYADGTYYKGGSVEEKDAWFQIWGDTTSSP